MEKIRIMWTNKANDGNLLNYGEIRFFSLNQMEYLLLDMLNDCLQQDSRFSYLNRYLIYASSSLKKNLSIHRCCIQFTKMKNKLMERNMKIVVRST